MVTLPFGLISSVLLRKSLLSRLPSCKGPSSGFLHVHPLCQTIIMANNADQMSRLEKNAQMAENIISDIYSKLSELGQGNINLGVGGGGAETPELLRLRQENEALRMEVAKWKELLLLRDIRNGGNPIVSRPQEVEMKKTKSEGATGLKVNVKPSKPEVAVGNQSKSSKSSAALNAKPSKPNVAVAASAAESKSSQNLGNNKKSKDQVSKTGSAAAGGPPPATKSSTSTTGGGGSGVEEVDVSKLDFRIGLITQCDPHPDADSLYVEKIDLGEEKPRTIISGLVKHVTLEEMRNRTVVVLANLKPAKMRGILSEGMVMCASSPEKVEILLPPAGSIPGDVVEVEGYPRAPETVLNPKKKIWESVAPDLMTNANKEATYKGKLWKVPGKGVVTSASLANTIIK